MTPGLLPTLDATATALTLGSGFMLFTEFTEDTQRLICITMNRKAAAAGGIEALAMRAIDTGDHGEALDLIASLAAELREGLLQMANIAGQLTAAKAA